MHQLAETPAVRRLQWILDGLDGVAGWGTDAAEVLAPAFAAGVDPEKYVAFCRATSSRYTPLTVVGMEASEHSARARIRADTGEIDVVACQVEGDPPHRITSESVQRLVPKRLTPRLPMDFSDYDIAPGGGLLVVVAGLPGSGKSTLADGLGRSLRVPVFAIDWILGALTPFGGRHFDDLRGVGTEQLTTLALRQLSLGQSVILDTPAEDAASRERWRSLAVRAGARFAAIDCVCSDPAVHRVRLESRERRIPGWHSRGDWANVQQRLREYPAWPDDVLRLDAVRPPQENLQAALDYLSAGRSSGSP